MTNMLFGSSSARKAAFENKDDDDDGDSTAENYSDSKFSSSSSLSSDDNNDSTRQMFARYDANNQVQGLVTQLVHAELGNFLVSNDFTDLEEVSERAL
tara:strand:- start:390 stop:683 length:294 start_codon:yes stop_codon:yes gene_type:complete